MNATYGVVNLATYNVVSFVLSTNLNGKHTLVSQSVPEWGHRSHEEVPLSCDIPHTPRLRLWTPKKGLETMWGPFPSPFQVLNVTFRKRSWGPTEE